MCRRDYVHECVCIHVHVSAHVRVCMCLRAVCFWFMCGLCLVCVRNVPSSVHTCACLHVCMHMSVHVHVYTSPHYIRLCC